MIDHHDFYDPGLQLHGDKCPATPLGLRVGAAAMNALGISRSAEAHLLALVELGEEYGGTCFLDGVQTITGCTFAKGNIEWHTGDRWGITLVEVGTGRAVRVTPQAEAPLTAQLTAFSREYRVKGIAAWEVPSEVVTPLVQGLMRAPDQELLAVSEVFTYRRRPSGSLPAFLCETCGEMAVEGVPAGRR